MYSNTNEREGAYESDQRGEDGIAPARGRGELKNEGCPAELRPAVDAEGGLLRASLIAPRRPKPA